jgi:hypothetical protein
MERAGGLKMKVNRFVLGPQRDATSPPTAVSRLGYQPVRNDSLLRVHGFELGTRQVT